MKEDEIRTLLDQVAAGALKPGEALDRLRVEPYVQLKDGLCIDTQRLFRTGQGEVVFGPNKSPQQLVAAVDTLSRDQKPVLVTKLTAEQGAALAKSFPDGNFWSIPGLFVRNKVITMDPPWPDKGDLLIVSAGGSDLPLALEALGTALFYDLNAGLVSDVGVAGLHRLLPHTQKLQKARLLIVVAGMEGALPSVLAGMTGKPIIGVPSSVGYGASFTGLTPLLSMLTACTPGIAVVNIDNGFGAASLAG
ncbi:MAG: nickel pincer cofactor biosynthesis protein LarB, partial [Desulfovibrionales bacterium]